MTDSELLTIKLQYQLDTFQLSIDSCFPTNGISFLFGKSGSGKTTLLRCIAGLEKHSQGLIQFKQNIWQNHSFVMPAYKRPIGFVFQEASLFPHLSVEQNILYGWKRLQEQQRRISVSQVVDLLGLEALLARSPQALSGGQRQRVAIARALLASPELLLMDEPLASLDNAAKNEILPYFVRLHNELELPIIVVSHALDEVMRLADHLAIIDNGTIVGQGAVNEMLTSPHLPLARLDNASALICGTIDHHDHHYQLTYVTVGQECLVVPFEDLAPGNAVNIRIFARDVSVTLEKPRLTSIGNILPAAIVDITPTAESSQCLLRLRLQQFHILSRITRKSVDHLQLKSGMDVFAQVKTVSLMP